MRCVAGVGLLALVGCNQLFSLSPTREFDAAVPDDVIPATPHVELTYQIAGVLPSGAPDPTTDPAIIFVPLAPEPVVKLAPLPPGQAMVQLTAATYSPDGSIPIPHEYLTQPWRLEYTLTGGLSTVPHEVQWSPKDGAGHLTVPLSGRLALVTLPADAGYQIKPNGVALFNSPEVVTTGLWTAGAATVDPTNTATVSYDFSHATFLSGKRIRPDPELGDRAFLIDYGPPNPQGCRVASGAVKLDSAAVQTGTRTTLIPTASWDTAQKMVMSSALDLRHVTRLQTKLGKLHAAINGNLLFGFSPSLRMPALTTTSPALPLPVPVMATVLRCPYSPNPGDMHPGTPLPNTAQPVGLNDFPQILHVQLADARTVLGITLASGMEAVLATGSDGFNISFPAAVPGQPMLTTPTKGTIDLAGDSEQLDIGPVRDPMSKPVELQLSFTPETSATDLTVRADYHDILLHRFEGAVLTTDRIYTVTAPAVRIDAAVLRPDTTYVFEIRTYKGHPSAASGDFAPIDYPYGAAIVFTRTFKTAP